MEENKGTEIYITMAIYIRIGIGKWFLDVLFRMGELTEKKENNSGNNASAVTPMTFVCLWTTDTRDIVCVFKWGPPCSKLAGISIYGEENG